MTERPPKLEKSCPLPKTHTRLHQVHDLWHRVAADYADPDAFVVSLNAALQALRSVHFMLNKESRNVPDFDAWNAQHVAEYESDPLRLGLTKARNYVEKRGDLELHSRGRMRLLTAHGEAQGAEFDVPPLLDAEQLASLARPHVPDRLRDSAVVGVERRWVAADFPDHELLDLLAYGYGKEATVVADAHRQCGVLMQTFGDEVHEPRPSRRTHLGGRLSCMVASAEMRTAYVHVSKGVLLHAESRDRVFTREDAERRMGELPFTPPDRPLAQRGGDFLDGAEYWAEVARSVTEFQGYHIPTLMLFEAPDGPPVMQQLNAADLQEHAVAMEAVAAEVQRLGAEAVIFMSEMRLTNTEEAELLVAAATRDGQRRQWRSRIHRDGRKVTLGPAQVTDGLLPDALAAVGRAWELAAR